MLVFVPLTLLGQSSGWNADLIFLFSALAIVPLAKLIGDATEELAVHTGPRIGGLLNATLGNAAELIITIFALREGLNDLVRASIVGSIIGNVLVVLGLSLLIGGLKNGLQSFSRRTAGMNGVLLILAVSALALPSLFDVALAEFPAAELQLSEGIAIIMIVLYALSVLFSFQQGQDLSHQGDEAHEPKWSIPVSVGILAVATIGIVLMSEALVGAVEVVTESLGLSEIFLGIIVIPIVGNIAEHIVAVQVAYKNKMELSLAISLGSSLQIALFVAPVLVFISLLINPDNPLLLVFTSFELVALLAAALLAAFVAQDGESNWLEGALLLGVYLMIALAFFELPAEIVAAAHGG
ncbi:calcium/proton exchanger [Phototrophicus methaneseepsis]|uniref:Ca(2+)/H(+) antiporter n=2 Tax=Phototrophicus methaneseepsis TaxID=2710758 RepID=A0A7S8EDW4_9CHLR|nr:calcium/proton exchanger [Phototrophicus methaneseepsis]